MKSSDIQRQDLGEYERELFIHLRGQPHAQQVKASGVWSEPESRRRTILVRETGEALKTKKYYLPDNITFKLRYDFENNSQSAWDDFQPNTKLLDGKFYIFCFRNDEGSPLFSATIQTDTCSTILIDRVDREAPCQTGTSSK